MKRLTLIEKAFLLKRTQPFATLDLDLLLGIADKLNPVDYDPEDYVFVVNEEANRMYFVVKGQVDIRNQDSRLIHRFVNGGFFGEESLFNNKPRAYEAYCPIETQLLTLSRTNLYTILLECPSVAIGFMQVYTAEMSFRPIEEIK